MESVQLTKRKGVNKGEGRVFPLSLLLGVLMTCNPILHSRARECGAAGLTPFPFIHTGNRITVRSITTRRCLSDPSVWDWELSGSLSPLCGICFWNRKVCALCSAVIFQLKTWFIYCLFIETLLNCCRTSLQNSRCRWSMKQGRTGTSTGYWCRFQYWILHS